MYEAFIGANDLKALSLDQCFAKTFIQPDGTVTLGRTVLEHCCIVGEVAKAILSNYPQALREEYFPKGTALVASSHDNGKSSPPMQEMLRRATDGYQPNSLPELANTGVANPNNKDAKHALISEATLLSLGVTEDVASIVGMHHGYRSGGVSRSTAEIYGGRPWHTKRLELLSLLEKHFKEEWPCIKDRTKAHVIAGLTTVADWVGSGDFFDIPTSPWQDKIYPSVANAGFLVPELIPGLSFKDIFKNDPYPVQTMLCDLCKEPGVYILEAPMGLGKTEAALYAAYRMLETRQATGIYFALPTRLTSNKIYERFTPFLQAILADNSPHRKALLLHGQAHLQQSVMGAEASPSHEWFCSLKRAILAPFGVGTIDQALLAAIPDTKHSFVRTFGLLGKVVILDEIHTYDTYTGVILDHLIKQLRQLSCTVIILSATITQNRRELLLGSAPKQQAYPLISVLSKNDKAQEHAAQKIQDRNVSVHVCSERPRALAEAIQRAQQGQQVLWIENTIAEAQETYRHIKATGADVATGLLHSRFIPKDREQIEQQWIQFFGKTGVHVRYAQGRILVGTQVLEQSLDIDADFLVSNICPVDMFLQRLGRLWRHELQNRHPLAAAEAILLVPALENTAAFKEKAFDKTGYVYDPYVLYRSLEVIRQYPKISLPSHIRPMLEATYADRLETGTLAQLKKHFNSKAQEFENMARVATSALGHKVRDTTPSTRYSERDDCQVLLAKNITTIPKGIKVTMLDGTNVLFPMHVKAYDKNLWRSLAIELAKNTLSVAKYLAPKPCKLDWLSKWLKDYVYLGKDNDGFRVAIVNDAGKARSMDMSEAHDTHTITYTSHLGYTVQKNKEG